MKNLNSAIREIEDNIVEINERVLFLDAIEMKSTLVIRKRSADTATLFELTDAELEMLKQFSLSRIKKLRKATFVDDKDIEIKSE